VASRRARERRRREARTPAVWGGHVAGRSANRGSSDRPAHGSRRGVRFSWRIVSAFIALAMVGLMVLFFVTNVFYVQTIAVGGLETLSKEEVFGLTGVAGFHLFWINPQHVEENLITSPTISDAQVRLGWPPQMVQIVIQERQPALVWEQAGTAVWLDLQGQVMRLREDRPSLVRVQYEGLADTVLGPNDTIPPDVVQGALQLHTLFPEMGTLRFSGQYGLGFRSVEGWDVWFGTGTDMPNKVLIYNALVQDLQGRGIQPNVISVADPNAVYFATLGSP
jgi:cell division septal protein FtsQ